MANPQRTESDSEEDSPNKEGVLIKCVESGDVESLRRVLRASTGGRMAAMCAMLHMKHTHGQFEGTLLQCSIVNSHSHVLSYLFEELIKAEGSVLGAESTELTFYSVNENKYSLALLLIAKGVNVNQQRQSDGNTLLHVVCGRKSPPMNFIQQLAKLKSLDVNIINKEGLTPLHIVATKIPGVTGREVVKLLRSKGARLDVLTPQGKTAAMLTKNPFIREVLSMKADGRPREMPQVSESQALELSTISVEEFEQRLATPPGLYHSLVAVSHTHQPLLSQEQIEDLGKRLCNTSMELREKKMRELVSKYTQPLIPEGRKLTAAEVEESSSRLCNEGLEMLESHREQLMEKYTSPELEGPNTAKLSEEEMQESVSRLYNGSVEHLKETAQKLNEKYLGKLGKPTKKRSKEEIKQYSLTLHDKSIADSKAKMQQVWERWVERPDEEKKVVRLSQEQQRAMADRLSRK